MIRYTVAATFADQATANRWLDWLRQGHIAEVIDGGAVSAEIIKLDASELSFAIEYRFPSREVFLKYEREHAPRLRAEGLALFPVAGGTRYQRSLGEVVWRSAD